MSRSGILLIAALMSSSMPAAAQPTQLERFQSSIEGKWTLGPSQENNLWPCVTAPMVVTLSRDWSRNQLLAIIENWPAGQTTTFDLKQHRTISVAAGGKSTKAEVIRLVPQTLSSSEALAEERRLAIVSDSAITLTASVPADALPMAFIQCPTDQ